MTDRATLFSTLGRLGAEQAQRDALASDPNPPKLQAALAMAAAAEDRAVTMGDLPELTKAYFGGNPPSSLPQQQAKFGAFVKAGCSGYAVQTMERVREIIRGTNDPKAAKKAASGIFEKAVEAMREALKADAVPGEARLREILFGKVETKDVEVEALKRAIASLETANNVSSANFAQVIADLQAAVIRREKEMTLGGAVTTGQAVAASKAEQAANAESVAAASKPAPSTALEDYILAA